MNEQHQFTGGVRVSSRYGINPNDTMIDLSYKSIDMYDLKYLTQMPNLQKLYLKGTGLTDEGMKELAKLTNLKSLALDRNNITDESMKELAKLTNLKWLSLKDTSVTDAGMEYVAQLKGLEKLYLDGTGVTDTKKATMKQLTIENKIAEAAARQPDNMVYKTANPDPKKGNIEIIVGLPRNTKVVSQ